jgi:catechol 2,3-dioxygenase-like lactoylglutathione lyase family enzyme
MYASLTHLAMHVRDLDACVGFYQDYCAMRIVHERAKQDHRVVWLAEPGREQEFILVLMPGGPGRDQDTKDYSHLGFAMESREAVDRIAAKAHNEGTLMWKPVEEPYPVGYYCGVRDPDGSFVEFSYGQPLGPGTKDTEEPDR